MENILSEDIACNLCNSRDTTLLYKSTLTSNSLNSDDFRCTSASYGVHPPIVRCNVCGLVYANPRWQSAVVEDSYSIVEDPIYIEERDGRELTFRRNLAPFEKFINGNSHTRRLLDVGCHIGVMVEIAQEHGWEAWGIEPSEWASQHARERGLHVIMGTLNDAQIPNDYFDVVTMWDVVEHLTDPAREINNAYRVLKPGGIIALHTIDIESLFARFMGKRWPWLMEMHLYYFSPRTLGKMLERAGFQVLEFGAQGRFLRLGYFITRIKPYSKSIYRMLSTVATIMRLNTIAIPINFGDLFTVYARKKNE
ncbi:MAG TPA: class I SAM-dependent methyltransferase [Bacteroidota bacterium]|nr:class I SAM-dependent methyltransferase [Bacteroidota bacterium]